MAISLVTDTSAAAMSGSTDTVTTPGIDTAGANLIVVSVQWASGGMTPTLSDEIGGVASGNTWVGCGVIVSNYLAEELFYCFSPNVSSSANHTFNATGNSGTAPSIGVAAFSGVTGTPSVNHFFVENLSGTSATLGNFHGDLLVSGLGTIGTSHTVSSGWTESAVDFASGVAVGGGIAWNITSDSADKTVTWNWSGSGYYAMTVLAIPQYALQRIQSAPVLKNFNQGGSSIGGIQVDAYAAPGVCWDGTQYVMTVSIWNNANSLWYSAFFTSPDLATWTYVTGSLQTPSGTDYIIGNGGIAWFGGKYYWVYNHYASSATTIGVATRALD